MNILVGYTGFVGSNICDSVKFDYKYNSKNIIESYDKNPDLLIYAGVSAEKYSANENPDEDMKKILQAQYNIKKINPKRLILISTIDVFKNPVNVDENTIIDTDNLHPYGYNRYKLECWVKENYNNSIIVRLPALFGKNIKKNFIYDYINRIPTLLNKIKYNELVEINPILTNYYTFRENGYYKCKKLSYIEKEKLKTIFSNQNFSSLNFTDSRNIYQFYPLSRLWDDINVAIKKNIKLLHLATEPISVSELYYYLSGEKFVNCIGRPLEYNYKTLYSKYFSNIDGYILNKETVKKMIFKFIFGRNSGYEQ